MEQSYKLTLFEAIIINVNIMIGAGIFINTSQLADTVGIWGGAAYIFVGILLFPLVLSMAKLLEYYPEGGFYMFGKKSINSITGFVAAFSYFIGKLASATLVTHTFVYLLQQSFSFFSQYNTFVLDSITLLLLLLINTTGTQFGAKVQRYVMFVKFFPIIFIIVTGLFYFNGTHLHISNSIFYTIPFTIPLILHATSGFEAACSLSKKIKNPKVNASRAVLLSYVIVISIYTIYQFLFYGIMGKDLAIGDYSTAFASVLSYIIPATTHLFTIIKNTLYISIALSALNSAFGMFYSNAWNLHILSEYNHIFFSNKISKRNKYGIAPFCIAIEGVIAFLYLIISNGNNTILQQISALGCTTAYTLSVVSLFATHYKNNKTLLLPLLALINCAIFIVACIYSLFITNYFAFSVFIVMLTGGIAMCMYIDKNKMQSHS